MLSCIRTSVVRAARTHTFTLGIRLTCPEIVTNAGVPNIAGKSVREHPARDPRDIAYGKADNVNGGACSNFLLIVTSNALALWWSDHEHTTTVHRAFSRHTGPAQSIVHRWVSAARVALN